MNDPHKDNQAGTHKEFSREVATKAARKLKAQRNPRLGVWSGSGMTGLIGWSIVVPTLLGAGLGMWLDKRHVGSYSWTLMLLLAGLSIGCFNAWHWVLAEEKSIHEEEEKDDE